MIVPISQQYTPELLGQAYQSINIGSMFGDSVSSREYYTVPQSVEISAGVGFVIVLDLVDADIHETMTSDFGGPELINAELKVNGVAVQISSARYEEPTGKIGALLNANIDLADLALVPDDATIDFSVTIETAAGPKVRKYMTNGKLVGREHVEKMLGGDNVQPVDELTISAVDRLNDKLEEAPRTSIIVYDPDKTKVELPADPSKADYIVDSAGRPIVPEVYARPGLNMHYIINQAYHNILGFKVITNLLNYSLDRVDFSIESSWHGAAAGHMSFLDPMIFNDANTLFLIDADTYVPSGYQGPLITADQHFGITDVRPFTPTHNAVLVTYSYRRGDWEDDEETGVIINSEVTDTFTDETGDPFDASYTKSVNEIVSIQVTNSLDPLTILSEYEIFRSVVTWGNVENPSAVLVRKVVSKEETSFFYDGDLAVGYAKTVWGLVTAGSATPDTITMGVATKDGLSYEDYTVAASPALIPVSTEVNQINWITDPLNAPSLIQASNVTVVTGLVYQSGEAEEVTNPITGGRVDLFRKWPILVAQSSGVIDDGGTRSWRPISTMLEDLIRVNRNQSKMAVRIIDHLNNTVKNSFTSGRVQERTGGGAGDDSNDIKTKTMLLRDLASEAEIGTRTPVSISVGGLSQNGAIALGEKILARFQTARRRKSIELVSPNLSVRRGSTYRVANRDGTIDKVFVSGFSVNCSNLGTDGHHIGMIVDTVKLPTR